MNTSQKDLWGDIGVQKGPKPPVVILKEQAALLDQKTNNLLRGEVISSISDLKEPGDKVVIHQFVIVVPALKNFRYELFSITQRIEDSYPVFFDIPKKKDKKKGVYSEHEFEQYLHEVLSSDYTKNIIQNLLIQSKE